MKKRIATTTTWSMQPSYFCPHTIDDFISLCLIFASFPRCTRAVCHGLTGSVSTRVRCVLVMYTFPMRTLHLWPIRLKHSTVRWHVNHSGVHSLANDSRKSPKPEGSATSNVDDCTKMWSSIGTRSSLFDFEQERHIVVWFSSWVENE